MFAQPKNVFKILFPFCAAIAALSALPTLAQKAQAQKPIPEALPDWNTLKAAYDYDSKKTPVFKTEEKPNEKAYVLHVEFTGPSGEKVTGLYARPKKEGVYPCVLMLHGWTSKKEDMSLWIGPTLVEEGLSYLALDAPRHGERKKANENVAFQKAWYTINIEGIRDYRLAINWLATRKEVDSRHLGLLGYSMGAMMGAIFTGIDDRIQAAVLCVGGDIIHNSASGLPEANRAAAYTISPSLYISHISPRPVLMLNGKQDNTVKEAASSMLYAAAKEPKEQELFDSGHILPKEALDKGVKWLGLKLKPQTHPKAFSVK